MALAERTSLTELRPGDIYFSANNVEVETGGNMIALDGRTINTNAYPALKEMPSLEYRVAPPLSLEGSGLNFSLNSNMEIGRNPVFLGGNLFFYTEYSESTAYPGYLCKMNSSGAVTRIKQTNQARLTICQNCVICIYQSGGSGTEAKALVLDANGNTMRDVGLGQYPSNAFTLFSDGDVVLVACRSYNSGTGNSFSVLQTSNNFETFTPILTNFSGLPFENVYSEWNAFQRHGSELWFAYTNGAQLYIWKSMNGGTSFSKVHQVNMTGGATAGYFLKGDSIYTFGYEISSSVLNVRAYKFNLSANRNSVVSYNVSSAIPMPNNANKFLAYTDGTSLTLNHSSGKRYKFSMTNLLWVESEGFVLGSGNTGSVAYSTDGKFLFYIDTKMGEYPSYPKEGSVKTYGGVLIIHIPSGKHVYITNPMKTDESGSYIPTKRIAIAGDNQIYVLSGTYSSPSSGASTTFWGQGRFSFSLNRIVLPDIEYGYLKTGR